jgi:hypothetical protein
MTGIAGLIMRPNDQLVKWVNGESVHNGATPAVGECCPDFSCCRPELLWSKMRRITFLCATDQERELMLMGPLKKVVKS